MTQKVWRAGRPIGIEVDNVIFGTAGKKPEEKRKLQHKAAQNFQRIWGLYKPAFENALESGNIDEAHRIWWLGCELWLYLAQNCDDEGEGGSPSIERFLMRGVPRRGTTMPVREEKLVPDVEDGKDTAVLAVNKKLLQAIASAKGILLHIQKAGINKDGLPDGKTTELVQKLVLMVIKVVAAEKSAREVIEQSKGGEEGDGEWRRSINDSNGEECDFQSGELSVLLKVLGKTASLDGLKTGTTQTSISLVLDEFIVEARKTCTDISSSEAKMKRREMRRALNDPSRGYNRFFKALRADQRRPTSVLKIGPTKTPRLTANMNEIFDAFGKQWHGVYNRLEDEPPDFEEFHSHYGQYMIAEPAGDLMPDGYQLAAKAAKAKADSAAGRDAWRPAELALLPTEAWHERAKLLRLCARKGAWPTAYKEVSSPCLHKQDKLDPDAGRAPPTVLDHRLLSVYTQLYRIEMGAWCKNHSDWLAKTIHERCYGAMAGKEPGEASWDAQAAVASVMEQGEEMVLAMLDYYKFFDSFEPQFYAKFLEKMGIHSELVGLFLDLNLNAVRRVKIGNALGKPFTTYNALGQGDPLTLVVALLHVSVQFIALDQICPRMKKSAVVDDRNIRGTKEDILLAWQFIYKFDVRAGHLTNPAKLALLATTKEGKAWCQELTLEGAKPKILDKEVLVGDVITTVRTGNGLLANKRVSHAVRGAEKILAMDVNQRLKKHGCNAVVIPRLLACSTWTRPAAKKLNTLRNKLVSTSIGRHRLLRCGEVVTAILRDASREDPWGALIAGTILKTRRMLMKSEERRKNKNRRHHKDYKRISGRQQEDTFSWASQCANRSCV